MTPFWLSAFLDFAPDHFDAGVAFWRGVTGYELSAVRGDEGEFATLLPPVGDDYLRVQRIVDGASRVHLDLHVDDPTEAAADAVSVGAHVLVRHERGYVVLRSPGGYTFCFVRHPSEMRPPAARWPGGHASLVDQVCLDIPAESFDTECLFWHELTGWESRASPFAEEFHSLVRPEGLPLRLLLQRLGHARGPVTAHLDVATTDRSAETARHLGLGASLQDRHSHWSVLTDPAGTAYCITDRRPETGMLA